MQESPQRTYSGWFYQHWKLGLLIAFSLSVAVRFYLASTLQLFGDEAFYRWESQHLAWAYSDLPPLTALGIKIGTLVGGESTLAVRSLFLFSGVSLPFAIFFLAHPIVGKTRALIGAGLSLLIPFTATVGVMAIPDSLLLTVCALALGLVERACRTDSTLWWLAAGVAACVGFLIHYRFVFLPLSLAPAFLFLPGLRSQLFRPGLWLALVIAALGLIPSLIFNLDNEFGAVGFHFSDRHPWSFHIEGLQYPLLQAAIVSPLLFVFMLLALWECLKRALDGESAYALLGSVSFAYIVGLSLLAPWVDQTSTTIHWSWFGYIPLLVVLPDVLRRIYEGSSAGRVLATASLALAGIFSLGLVGLALAPLHYEVLPKLFRASLTVKMAGWDELRAEVLKWHRPGEHIYSSDYYVAAQLQQSPFDASGITVIDHEKIHRDGRELQLRLWRTSQQFAPSDGASGLIVVDHQTAGRYEIYRQIDFLCGRFTQIETLATFSQFDGKRRYGLYRGIGARETHDYSAKPAPGFCTPAMLGEVRLRPKYRDGSKREVLFRGFLLAQPEGIKAVKVRVGGMEFRAEYNRKHLLAHQFLGDKVRDPNFPLVGYRGIIDTGKLANGRYEMEFVGVSNWGREEVFHRQVLTVDN